MKSIRIIAPLIILHLAACKKPPSAPQPDKLTGDKAMLIGTWNWTHTHHRFNWCDGPELNETIEPEEDTYSIHLKKDGYVDFYKNGEIMESYYIKVNLFYEKEEGENVFMLNLDGLENQHLSGQVYADSMWTYDYPYIHEIEGCEEYKNYFTKE